MVACIVFFLVGEVLVGKGESLADQLKFVPLFDQWTIDVEQVHASGLLDGMAAFRVDGLADGPLADDWIKAKSLMTVADTINVILPVEDEAMRVGHCVHQDYLDGLARPCRPANEITRVAVGRRYRFEIEGETGGQRFDHVGRQRDDVDVAVIGMYAGVEKML